MDDLNLPEEMLFGAFVGVVLGVASGVGLAVALGWC